MEKSIQQVETYTGPEQSKPLSQGGEIQNGVGHLNRLQGRLLPHSNTGTIQETLHQVKAHDVRAFAASKVFQSRVSLEQILAACHWKSHNTFTQFYLKDVAWADSELYHLGPIVAAQQILQ